MSKNYSKNEEYTKNIPTSFLNKIKKKVKDKEGTDLVINVIRAVLAEFDSKKYYVTQTRNWRLSRFVSVPIIIKMKLRTCGSISSVVTSVLRNLGYPVKLIDGKLYSEGEWRRHSWLEVQLGKEGKFVSFDPFAKNFMITKKHRKSSSYTDWSEMERLAMKNNKKYKKP